MLGAQQHLKVQRHERIFKVFEARHDRPLRLKRDIEITINLAQVEYLAIP
jgi:hypothetical protein